MKFNPLQHPICFSYPNLIAESAWMEHVPFAFFLISTVKPKTFVELGTWKGVSYCAFCQAIKSLNLDTKAYAVDSWLGDPHAGRLDDEDFLRLKQYHDPLYSSFSTLIRSTFDEAVDHFADGEIDLLHIDGFHSYEAIKHDFETWFPKMSQKGIILLHDTNERRAGFGVHKFWHEVSEKFPSFEFLHGHGLGLLAVGSQIPDEIEFIFQLKDYELSLIRNFFKVLGERLESIKRMQELEKTVYNQERLITELRTYESTVKHSLLLRAYRSLKNRGL
jgi:hypothetical protein